MSRELGAQIIQPAVFLCFEIYKVKLRRRLTSLATLSSTSVVSAVNEATTGLYVGIFIRQQSSITNRLSI